MSLNTLYGSPKPSHIKGTPRNLARGPGTRDLREPWPRSRMLATGAGHHWREAPFVHGLQDSSSLAWQTKPVLMVTLLLQPGLQSPSLGGNGPRAEDVVERPGLTCPAGHPGQCCEERRPCMARHWEGQRCCLPACRPWAPPGAVAESQCSLP